MHFAQALYFDRWKKAKFLVATTVYADTSGSEHDQPVILIAGFYNTVDHWIEFGGEWNQLLKDKEITCLHMTGPKEPWKENERTRDAVLTPALDIIRKSGAQSFVFLVVSDDFNKWTQQHADKGFDKLDAFVFAGLEVVTIVNSYCDQQHCAMPEFVFETSDKKQHDTLRKVLSKYNLPEPIFRRKQEHDPQRTVVALQAADFLAYEILRGWKDYLNIGHPTRKYLQEFNRIPHPPWGFIDKEKFDMLIPVSATIKQIQAAIDSER